MTGKVKTRTLDIEGCGTPSVSAPCALGLCATRRGAEGQLALRFPGDPGAHRRFWQRRYYDFNVYSEKKLREKLDYMHTNPVKRRLVSHPRDWPWSSWTFYEQGHGLIRVDRPR